MSPNIDVTLPPPVPSGPPETVVQEWICVTDQPSRAYGRVEPAYPGGTPLLHDHAFLAPDTLARLGGQPARIRVTLEVLP